MDPGLAARLAEQRPALKARWAELLLAAPLPHHAAAPVTPEMLVFLLDDSLDRLLAQSGSAPSGERPTLDLNSFAPIRAGCQCGLHLLLGYYLAGSRALRELLPDEPAADRCAVLNTFHRLANEEMTALCAGCLSRGGAMCGLPHPGRNEPR